MKRGPLVVEEGMRTGLCTPPRRTDDDRPNNATPVENGGDALDVGGP